MAQYNLGDTLTGGYMVVDIKAGGMGVVYMCHQPSTTRDYAIKTVRLDGHADADEFLRLFREEVNNWIRISSEQRHPNIVDALLYNEDERWLFLEYVDGPTLHELSNHVPPHPKHAMSWTLDIAQGMAFLHDRFSLLHRDLKPRNVLVTQQGLVGKISDLGIGKVLQEELVAQTVVGTPGYIAPETLEGATDFRSDIFSYGALVYRLLTSKDAFGRGMPTRKATVTPPSDVNALVPPELDAIVIKCLRPDPADRYQSFQEVIDALRQVPPAFGESEPPGYRLCDTHAFHSPVSDKHPECLFCHHQAEREEKLQQAESWKRHHEYEASDPTVYGATVQTLKQRPALDPTLASPAATMTEPGPAPRRRGDDARRSRPLALVGVVALAVVIVTVVAGLAIQGGDAATSGPEKEMARTGDPNRDNPARVNRDDPAGNTTPSGSVAPERRVTERGGSERPVVDATRTPGVENLAVSTAERESLVPRTNETLTAVPPTTVAKTDSPASDRPRGVLPAAMTGPRCSHEGCEATLESEPVVFQGATRPQRICRGHAGAECDDCKLRFGAWAGSTCEFCQGSGVLRLTPSAD